MLNHQQNVEAAQKDRVDVREVDREDLVGLGGEKLSLGRTGPQRGGIDADVLQDLPDGEGGHPVAEADQLTVNASGESKSHGERSCWAACER